MNELDFFYCDAALRCGALRCFALFCIVLLIPHGFSGFSFFLLIFFFFGSSLNFLMFVVKVKSFHQIVFFYTQFYLKWSGLDGHAHSSTHTFFSLLFIILTGFVKGFNQSKNVSFNTKTLLKF